MLFLKRRPHTTVEESLNSLDVFYFVYFLFIPVLLSKHYLASFSLKQIIGFVPHVVAVLNAVTPVYCEPDFPTTLFTAS